MDKQELLENILRTTSACVFWKDKMRRFLGVNRAFLEYYGFRSEAELIGKTDEDMGWHSDPDPFRNDELRVLQGESTYRVHGKCIARGEERDILASKSPMYENGKIIGLVGIFEDVTEEYRQRRENARLTAALNDIPAGVCVFKRVGDDLVCVSVNRFFSQLAAFISEEQLVGKSFLVQKKWLVNEKEAEEFVSALLHEEGIKRCTICYRTTDGERMAWFHLVGKKSIREDGEELFYISYMDVTKEKKSETEAAESSLLYEQAVNQAKLVLWEYDIPNRRVIMHDNKATREDYPRFGIGRIITDAPETLSEKIAEADREKFLEMYRKIENGEAASGEFWYVPTAEGEERCERISYTVFCDEAGKPVRALGMGQNITEEKNLENRYNQELERLDIDAQSNLVSSSRSDLSGNRVLSFRSFSDSAFMVSSKYSYDRMIEDISRSIDDPAERRRVRETLDRVALIREFYKGNTSCHLEYRRRNQDNALIWISVQINTYAKADGRIESFTFAYDITNERIRGSVIDRMTEMGYDHIGLIDLKTGSFEYVGSPGEGHHKTAHHESFDAHMRKKAMQFVPGEESQQVQERITVANLKKHLEKESSYELSYSRTGKNGEIRRKRFQCCYLDDTKESIFFARTDITKQYLQDTEQVHRINEAMLKAERANEAKSTFLSSMSHDLRTPLNGIIGFSDFALKEKDEKKQLEFIRNIKASGELLRDLVNDTLDLSRIESGKYELKPEPTDSREIGEAVISALRPAAETKGVRLVADIAKFPNKTIWVDRLKLQKIYLNLISNAIKYTPAGGTVWTTVITLDPPVNGCNRRIIVKDTGIGVSQAFISQMFEPFTQENRRESEGIIGTGLGLSIVKRTVDLMGGSIRVESEIGKGTKFTVDLPIQRVEEGRREKRQKEKIEKSLAGLRILLCEDNELNAEIAVHLLTDKGIKVECAVNGKEGLEKFMHSGIGYYNAVLMDIRMPVMDGYEAAQAIRILKRPDARRVPIIPMTADVYAEEVRKCEEAGMNGHIEKPVDPVRMFEVLDEYLPE